MNINFFNKNSFCKIQLKQQHCLDYGATIEYSCVVNKDLHGRFTMLDDWHIE
jgi:hypothetical protein